MQEQSIDMAANEPADETAVDDRYAVTIPAAIRNRLDIDPGDRIKWTVTEGGAVDIEVVKQCRGVFDDFEPVDMGETDAAADHDEIGVDAEDRPEN